LTAEDFEGDLALPGSSDRRYSKDFLDALAEIVESVFNNRRKEFLS
jgi:hypothetical protein